MNGAWSLHRTTPPTTDPVGLAAAKNHLRVDLADDDELIAQQVRAATEHVEAVTGRTLITTGWRLTLDCSALGAVIEVPRPPHQPDSIDAVTTYLDDGTTVELDPASYYFVPGQDEPGRLVVTGRWPSGLRRAGAVTVDFTAGYGDDGDSIPQPLVAAIKLTLGTLYEHRETQVVGTVAQALPHSFTWLVNPHRIGSF